MSTDLLLAKQLANLYIERAHREAEQDRILRVARVSRTMRTWEMPPLRIPYEVLKRLQHQNI